MQHNRNVANVEQVHYINMEDILIDLFNTIGFIPTHGDLNEDLSFIIEVGITGEYSFNVSFSYGDENYLAMLANDRYLSRIVAPADYMDVFGYGNTHGFVKSVLPNHKGRLFIYRLYEFIFGNLLMKGILKGYKHFHLTMQRISNPDLSWVENSVKLPYLYELTVVELE